MAAKKKEDDELKDFIKGKGSNSEMHSITQSLGSFTDMANSLKSTIDDVDAMKNTGGLSGPGKPFSAFTSISSISLEKADSSATNELKA